MLFRVNSTMFLQDEIREITVHSTLSQDGQDTATEIPSSAKVEALSCCFQFRQHLNLGLHSSTSDTGRKTVPLIRVKLEHSYPEVVKWSDKQAETYLRKHDVLPQKKEKVNCWQCGEILSRAKFVIQWSRPDLRRCVTMFQLPYAWSASFAAVTCIAFLDSLLVLHAARICAPVQNLSSASLLDRRNS